MDGSQNRKRFNFRSAKCEQFAQDDNNGSYKMFIITFRRLKV